MGLRDTLKAVSPVWLASGTAERFLYNFGLIADAQLERFRQGVLARMPGYGTTTALPLSGQDRLIDQGPNESSTSYTTRLQGWLDTWRRAGGPVSKLQALYAYFSPLTPFVGQVNSRGTWDWYDSTINPLTQPPVHYQTDHGTPGTGNWDWDGLEASLWARCWIVISAAGVGWTLNGTWGDGATWGDNGQCFSLNVSTSVPLALRSLIARWRGAHAIFPWMVATFNDAYMRPFVARHATGMPNGKWANWGVDDGMGNYGPAREPSGRYIYGVT